MSSILFYSTRKTQKWDRIGAPFRIFYIDSIAKYQKNEGGPFADIKNVF